MLAVFSHHWTTVPLCRRADGQGFTLRDETICRQGNVVSSSQTCYFLVYIFLFLFPLTTVYLVVLATSFFSSAGVNLVELIQESISLIVKLTAFSWFNLPQTLWHWMRALLAKKPSFWLKCYTSMSTARCWLLVPIPNENIPPSSRGSLQGPDLLKGGLHDDWLEWENITRWSQGLNKTLVVSGLVIIDVAPGYIPLGPLSH